MVFQAHGHPLHPVALHMPLLDSALVETPPTPELPPFLYACGAGLFTPALAVPGKGGT